MLIGEEGAVGRVAGDAGWHQGAVKLTEMVGSAALVVMGARLYVPALGRFLQVEQLYSLPTSLGSRVSGSA